MRALIIAMGLLLSGAAWGQPVLTNGGSNDAAFAASVNVTVTAASGDLVYAFGAFNSGTGDPTFSTCGAINSTDWVTRYVSGGVKLVAAKAPSALSGCTLTVSRSGATGAIGMYGAWSGTSAAIFDGNFPSAALSNTGSSSKPTGVSTITAQAHDVITTWQVNLGDTAVDCGIATGGTGSWSSVTASRNDINVGGVTGNYLSATVTQSFTPTNAGGSCASKASWVVVIDAITTDTLSTGRSRFIP